ncbi:MAG: hypothetical protein LDL26_03260 [Caenispirillum bisanense]|nr:hypothetical protein [Caenispirillum bisanense]MCA1972019.1 hypothetical protein [Caenispirillum sp.]
MALSKSGLFVVGATFALAGCSVATDALFPADDGTGQTTTIGASSGEMGGSPTVSGEPLEMGTGTFEPSQVSSFQPSGTFVGQKVQQFHKELQALQGTLRNRNQELQQLRNEVMADSAGYHERVASINARLQVGTTPGNPTLVQRWNEAQTQLDEINSNIAYMNQLSTQIASDSAMAAYLLESIRAAYNLSGAVELDHAQLRTLEDETAQTVVLIDRLLGELSEDVARQQTYVSNERNNLNTLAVAIKTGQTYGQSLGYRNLVLSGNQPALSAIGPAGLPAARLGGQPLVVIRFDDPNVAYEPALYNALSGALAQNPNAGVEVVSVSPTNAIRGREALNANTSRRHAEKVVRSLTDMGLSGDRIRLSATTSPDVPAPQVQVYVR